MILLPVLLITFHATDVPATVRRRAAAAYEKAHNCKLSASLSVRVPGEDVIITIPSTVVYATGAILPAGAPIPVLDIAMVVRRSVFSDAAQNWNRRSRALRSMEIRSLEIDSESTER